MPRRRPVSRRSTRWSRRRDDHGQGLAEYALAASVVAGLAAALLTLAAQALAALDRAIEVMLNA